MEHPEPVSFLTVESGTPVVDRFGRAVGDLEQVMLLENGGFDGLVVLTDEGTRFVDAPEVRRISGGAITLGTTVEEIHAPGPHGKRVHGHLAARYGRTDVTEADRDAAIECLKRAFVRDELTTGQLSDRVGVAHRAETLDELDLSVAGVVEP